MDCPFEASWGEVTPALAAEWLAKHNTRNRPKKRHSIAGFARDMLANRWCPNHQGIAFAASDGALIDGQNRLFAIVESGRPQWMMVFRNVPEKIEGIEATVMETIDRGVARTIADVLRLEHGMKQEATIAAQAAVQIARLCVKFPSLQVHKPSASQTVGVIRLFQAEMEWMLKVRSSVPGLRTPILWGTLAFAYACAPTLAMEFAEKVVTADGEPSDPAARLYAALTTGEVSTVGLGSDERRCAGGMILQLMDLHALRAPVKVLPYPEALKTIGKYRQMIGERVLQCAALFPLLPSSKTAQDTTREPAPCKAPEPRPIAPPKPAATAAPKYEPPVVRAEELRVSPEADRLLSKQSPAAQRLLAAAGGQR